jgi:hypothetical protein
MRRVALQHPTRREGHFSLAPSIATHRSNRMLDAVMLGLGLSFFVAGIGYAYACERL